MFPTVWAVVKDGKIELLEPMSLQEGVRILVTLVPPEEEVAFWLRASEQSLSEVWNNLHDDTYAKLLEK